MIHKITATPHDTPFESTRKQFLTLVQQGKFTEALALVSEENEKDLFLSTTTSKKSTVLHLLHNYFKNKNSRDQQKIILRQLTNPNSLLCLFLKRAAPYAGSLLYAINKDEDVPLTLFQTMFPNKTLSHLWDMLGFIQGTSKNNKDITFPHRHHRLWQSLTSISKNPDFASTIRFGDHLSVLLLGPGIYQDTGRTPAPYSPEIKELLDTFNGKIAKLVCIDEHDDVLEAAAQGAPPIDGYYQTDPYPKLDAPTQNRPQIETRKTDIEWTTSSLEEALRGRHDLIMASHILTYPFENHLKNITQLSLETIAAHNLDIMNQFILHLTTGGHLIIDEQTLQTIAAPFGWSANIEEQTNLFLSLLVRKTTAHVQVLENRKKLQNVYKTGVSKQL